MNVNSSLLKNLNFLQKKLLRENPQNLIIANESLNIIKGHPSYLEIFETRSFLKYLKLFLRYSLINLYSLFKSLIFYKNRFKQIKDNIDCLLISHLISNNKLALNNGNDFYFGDFEKNKNFKKLNSFKVLINHTKKYKSGYSDNNLIILQNYADFKYSIKILAKLYFLFFKYLIKSNKNDNKNLINIIALEFINPKTLRNLILKYNFEHIINKRKIKKVFFTFEGFAWERFLCEAIKKNDKNSELFGYQFAILIKTQNSILNQISNKYLPNKIITSGINNYKILKKKFSKIIIIGSSRFTKNKKRLNNFKKNCLVLPEGIDSECNILLDFVARLASKTPKINFIIRFHPLTSISKIKKKFLKTMEGGKLKNIIFSTKKFNFDLQRSSICLHRGSTSAITAAQSGLMPIYYNFKSHLNIDPMFQIDKNIRYVNDYKDFEKLTGLTERERKSSFNKLNKYLQDYFVKFNHQTLNKILSK